MNKSIRLAVALAVGTSAGLAQAETVYCVHDDGLNDSQFCYVPIPPANQVLPLLPLPVPPGAPPITYENCDIEALDIRHGNDLLFAASGDDTPRKGHLYFVETDNLVGARGDIFDLGNVVARPLEAVKEIDAISFHPTTDDLWGWAQDRGLFVIPQASVPLPQEGTQVISTCQERIDPPVKDIPARMVIVPKEEMEIESITWNQNGTALFGVENCHTDHPDSHGAPEDGWGSPAYNYDTDCGIKIWRGIDPITPASWMQVCENLFDEGETPQPVAEIEAIESLPPGFGAKIGIMVPPGGDLVLIGFHGPNQLSYAVLFIPPAPGAACAIVWEGGINSKPFNDIEGLAYSPLPIPIP